jgi:hypothetical protein
MTSTSVKVPIAELKYKSACVATSGSDSRSGKVAVCVIDAVGGGDADRSRRPSSCRTASVSRRLGRRPATMARNGRSGMMGRCIYKAHMITRSQSSRGGRFRAVF